MGIPSWPFFNETKWAPLQAGLKQLSVEPFPAFDIPPVRLMVPRGNFKCPPYSKCNLQLKHNQCSPRAAMMDPRSSWINVPWPLVLINDPWSSLLAQFCTIFSNVRGSLRPHSHVGMEDSLTQSSRPVALLPAPSLVHRCCSGPTSPLERVL